MCDEGLLDIVKFKERETKRKEDLIKMSKVNNDIGNGKSMGTEPSIVRDRIMMKYVYAKIFSWSCIQLVPPGNRMVFINGIG